MYTAEHRGKMNYSLRMRGVIANHAYQPHLLVIAMAKRALADLTGYRLTCGNEEALNWFNKGAFAYATVREDGLPMLCKALELDNSILLAHCVLVGRSRAV